MHSAASRSVKRDHVTGAINLLLIKDGAAEVNILYS